MSILMEGVVGHEPLPKSYDCEKYEPRESLVKSYLISPYLFLML